MQLDKALAALGVALACATATVSLGGAEAAAAAAQPEVPAARDERPNVVVLYVDDVDPKTPWLWGNRERTPHLARFRNQGVEFRHAVGSTPLCGPSRATLLTGQYSHNHGVTGNNLREFDPSDTLATRLQDAGYHTMLVGKAGNGIEDVAPRRKDVERLAQGFDHYDVIWKRPVKFQGQFYGYSMWTRDEVLRKGYRSQDHSTYVVGKRLAGHIRKAPDDQPVFAIASLNSGHDPNTPFRWHEDAEDCARVGAYKAPSYNENDVSDKPAYIRDLPRLKRSSFDLRSRCEEFMGVEATLRRIRGALRETGRLRNTLFVFTADNGYLMGDHRMPGVGDKWWPHSIPIPLYVLWPEALGNERRVVREPVSTVDLPVTICALAGCSLKDADGLDITPLLRAEADELEREYLYLELLRPRDRMPPWYGLMTTRAFDEEVVFQYVEYRSGERELYNLTRDPYRLHNLAAKDRKAALVEELHRRLHDEVITPERVAFPLPRTGS